MWLRFHPCFGTGSSCCVVCSRGSLLLVLQRAALRATLRLRSVQVCKTFPPPREDRSGDWLRVHHIAGLVLKDNICGSIICPARFKQDRHLSSYTHTITHPAHAF